MSKYSVYFLIMEENYTLKNGTKEHLNPYVYFDVQIGETKGDVLI